MKNYVVNGLLLLIAFLRPASSAVIPIFSDDFESGTMSNWTTTSTTPNPLEAFTPSNAVPAGGRWSAMMNVSADRMHRNIIADNGGAEASGHLMFSFWIYDDGSTGTGPNRVFNELRGYSGGTGYANGSSALPVGTLAQLLAAGKFNMITLPGEVFTATKYQGRVGVGPGTGGTTGWFNLNGPGSPNRSIGWHRFDIEVMPGGTIIRFFVDGILSRTFSGAVVADFDSLLLGPGLGSQQGNAWIDGISVGMIDDPPTISCPSNQTVVASSSSGAVVTYPAPTVTDDGPAPTVVCNPPSGSTFPPGTTTVVCTATDSRQQQARCTFLVRVLKPLEPEIRFPGPQLPPPTSVFISPADSRITYANGFLMEDIRSGRFTQSQPPPPPGGSQQQSFNTTMEMRVRTPNGETMDVSGDGRATVLISHVLDSAGRSFYETEMLQLDISGGGLPPGIMVRESPTLRSTGQTSLRMDGASAQIGSFFDIFTELSVDGGMTWSPAEQAATVELRLDPTMIPPVPAPSDLLPPPNHFFATAAPIAYPGGIIIRDIRHKHFSRSLPPPSPDGNQLYEFGALVDMLLSTDGGLNWRAVRAPAANTVALRHVSGGGGGAGGIVCGPCTFEAEMLQMQIMGGDLPPGVILRESPTRRSLGGTALRHLPDGTAVINSFFDIFTELSMNGGESWAGAGAEAHVELTFNAPETPEPSPNLPPPDGEYVSSSETAVAYPQGIILKDIKHSRFTQTLPPPPPGGTQMHQFGSQVDFQVSMDGGLTFAPGQAPADLVVVVRSSIDSGPTRFFDTEILQMDMAGGSLPQGVRLRESPTRASLGRTSVRQASDSFQISSSFAIFTELTIDAGENWRESITGPSDIILRPGNCYKLECPDDITVYSISGSRVVNYPAPVFTFTSPCTLPVTPWVTCTPSSGSAFPMGTTTVTCRAEVAPGAALATCSFTVRVRPVLIYNFLNSFARITLQLQDGRTEDISLTGQAEVELDLGQDGSAGDLDGDGLDDAENRMTSLSLQGMSQTLGEVRLRLRESPSRGMTEEAENRKPGALDVPPYGQGNADSFFDVFVEIHAGGQVFHTVEPMHMAANLNGVPPARSDTYSETKAHDIVDANGTFTGIRWLRGIYIPYPEYVDILCPGNVTVTGNGPTPVNYGVVPAQSDCFPVTIGCNPPSGSTFPIGTTPVTCTATDACGNTDQCQFFVTVKPTHPQFVNFRENYLPPPQGMYQNLLPVRYGNGVSLRNVVHRNATPSYPTPALGDTATHEFTSEVSFEYSLDGASYSPATAPAQVVVKITHTQDEGGSQVFDTEMLAMDIAGGSLPAGVMLRESPTRASLGRTSIKSPRDSASGQAISSFFDIFTELTFDGGMNWSPSEEASAVHLAFDPTKIPPVHTPTPILPVRHGVFVSGAGQAFDGKYLIRGVQHRYFSDSQPPPPPGESRLYEFDAIMDFQLSGDGGQNWDPVRANAKTAVVLHHAGRLLNADDRPATDIFDTEMLQLDIRGGDLPQGVMLRESPTRRSSGGTALRQMPDGTYQVHSFFDVFTEISFNGGQTWQFPDDPENAPRVELQSFAPEVQQPNDLLPPPQGTYGGTQLNGDVQFRDGIRLRNIASRGFSKSSPPPQPGESKTYDFDSIMTFEISTDGGQTWMPASGDAHHAVRMDALSGQVGETRYFDTEMLQMDIRGSGAPFMIRESPTRASLGRTSIRSPSDPASGQMISSFFDIFTELSLDGGETWSPALTGPVNVALVPNKTVGKLVCADGKPLANCIVRVDFFDSNGLVNSATTTTDATGSWEVIITCDQSSQVGEYYVISSPCCPHTWTIPKNACWGDLGTLVCDLCGQEPPCVTPPAGMVDWWTFDEAAGPIANDIAGTANNLGVHKNGPSVVAGKVQNALCFNGQNQWVEVRDHPEVNFLGVCAGPAAAESFTIDAWIRVDSTEGVMTILDKRVNPQSPQGYTMFVFNGRLGFQMATGGGGPICNSPGAACDNYVEPTASITPGAWHLVAVTVDRCTGPGGPGTGTLFVDGSPVLTFTPRSGDLNNPSDLFIGMRNPAFGYNFFRGCIDELEYFKRALTVTDIQSIYRAGSAGKCKPCLRCPDDIRVQTCERGTNVCYQLPSVENCPGLTVRCDPPPCSFFPANTSTIVTCETFNAAGLPVERCQFAVTVIGDNEPPSITCPQDLSLTVDPGQCGRLIQYPLPPATDNCPGVQVSCTPPPGSVFPVGTTTVTCTAADASGNTNTCTFQVNIRDHYPPIITCPQDITVRSCDRRTRVTYAPTATDNCPGVTVVCVPPSGTAFPAGSHPVTCTATDASGNTASCSFKVTVIVIPRPRLEITYLPNGRVRICWESECDWRLQCTRSLNPPIMWQFVSAVVSSNGNRYCVTLPTKAAHQFYRLYRREVIEVEAQDDLLPPLGTYRSPRSVSVPLLFAANPDQPLLMREFAFPIWPNMPRRPAPCATCPPDIHQLQTQMSFQMSNDGGETWMDATADAIAAVAVHASAPGDTYDTEILSLEARGNTGPRPFMIRESPTLRSTGRTSIFEAGTVVKRPYSVESFFDVFVELSLDGGETWQAAETDIPMDLIKP